MVKNWYKKAKTFNELYDYFDDDTIKNYNSYETQKDKEFEVVDYDALEKGEIPVVEIGDDEEFLADTYGDEKTVEEQEEVDRKFDEKIKEPYEPPFVGEEIPTIGNNIEAINYAIKNNKVLKIDYSTKKGINIKRIVEPHLVYNSKKGNLIVVTYDRSVRDIRAFIVNNIVNYDFTGREFKERMKVIPKSEKNKIIPKYEKGIENMANINNSLIKVAGELKEKGLEKSSVVVNDVLKIIKKEAQYTGAYLGCQGYWIRNRRCWDNCYRQKRTAEPKKAAQEVWFECWDEYLKSINNPKDNWAKYASVEDIKINKGELKELNKKFAEEVMVKVNNGMGLPESIYDILNKEVEEYKDKVIEQAGKLTELAVSLNKNGFKELSIKVAEISNEVLKEAGFFGWVGEKFKDWAAKKGKLLKYIREIADKSIDLSRRLKQQLRYTRQPQASDKEGIIKKGQKHNVRGPGGRFAPGIPVEPQTEIQQPPQQQISQQQDYRVNYIREAQELVADVNEVIAWMGQSVPQDNPRVKSIVQTALINLTNANKSMNNLILGGNINIGSLIKEIDNMTNAANTAMFSIYNEPTSVDQNRDGIDDTQQIDQNRNGIDDRVETKSQPWEQPVGISKRYQESFNNFVGKLNSPQKEYLKSIL